MLSGTLFSPSFNYFIDLLEILFEYPVYTMNYTSFTTSFLKYLSIAFMKTNNFSRGFLGGSVVKNQPASARDMGSIPGSGRFTGEGNGNPVFLPVFSVFLPEKSHGQGSLVVYSPWGHKSWT